MTFEALKNNLKIYGTAEQCELVDDKVHVKISGFNNNMTITFQAARNVVYGTENNWPIVQKCEVDKGIFHLILRKKSE